VSPFVYVSEFNEKISIGRTEYRKTAWHARFVEFVSDGRCHFGPDRGAIGGAEFRNPIHPKIEKKMMILGW